MAFPYVFPGAYSNAAGTLANDQYGWIHSPDALWPSSQRRRQLDVTFDGKPAGLSPEHQPQPARPGRQPADPDQPPSTATGTELTARPGGASRPGARRSRPTGTIPTVQVNVGPRARQPNGLPAPASRRGSSRRRPTDVTPGCCRQLADPRHARRPMTSRSSGSTPQLFSDGCGDNSIASSWAGHAVDPLWAP